MGRPSSFTQDTADTICERLATGESLRTICKDDAMPDQRTVFRWLADEERELFRQQYARARELQADALFDEILDLADGGTADVQRDRLSVDARKWMAGKLQPRKYGDKVEHQHSGAISIGAALDALPDD